MRSLLGVAMRGDSNRVRTLVVLGAVVASMMAGDGLAAENWPTWRGPFSDGSQADADPPTTWGAEENIVWKVPVPGRGNGSPVIWDGQIILLTAVDTEMPPAEAVADNAAEVAAGSGVGGQSGQGDAGAASGQQGPGGRGGPGGLRGGGFGAQPAPTTIHEYIVMSFNLADGTERWRTVVARAVPHEGGHQTNTFASSSAVTDGQRIYVSFGSQGIHCLDMEGNVIWSKSLGRMRTRNQFGEGASPTLAQGTLIVPWDQEEQSKLFALNAADGEIRWQAERDEPTTWATALAVERGGRTQVVTNGTVVRSYDLETGELLWSCGGQVSNPIPSPVRLDDFVVCMTGYRGNAIYALPLDARGDISDTDHIRWHNHDAAPYVASPVLYKGQLYLTKERTGVMTSLDARTGEVLIAPQRLSAIRDVYSSPVAAADRIYFTGRDGATVVIRHGRTLEELAVNQLGEPVDSSPAIVGDSLIIRGAEHLYRIAER